MKFDATASLFVCLFVCLLLLFLLLFSASVQKIVIIRRLTLAIREQKNKKNKKINKSPTYSEPRA